MPENHKGSGDLIRSPLFLASKKMMRPLAWAGTDIDDKPYYVAVSVTSPSLSAAGAGLIVVAAALAMTFPRIGWSVVVSAVAGVALAIIWIPSRREHGLKGSR